MGSLEGEEEPGGIEGEKEIGGMSKEVQSNLSYCIISVRARLMQVYAVQAKMRKRADIELDS